MAATKKQLQRSANIFILSGIGVTILSIAALASGDDLGTVALFLVGRLIGVGLWVVGCMKYALSKGYSQWLGLLGLAALIGLIVLAVLPDKWSESAPPRSSVPDSPTNYPRYPQG
jgi:hypothetical protein